MPFQETITIINNSGKVISTGKQLLSIFKDAKAAYNEKKSHLRAQRGLQRAYTSYDDPRGYPEEYYYQTYDAEIADEPYDDRQSRVSRQSRRSHRSHGSRRYRSHDRGSEVRSERGGRPRRSGEALTVANLERLTEVGSTAPSRAPIGYHSPYAETARGSMALSRPNLNPSGVYSGALDAYPQGGGMAVANRTLSEPNLAQPMPSDLAEVPKKKKDIDMNLAYGSLPPDLQERVDLDPNYGPDNEEEEEEEEAEGLIEKIEGLLDEAQCMQHSATAIMEQLQQSPERAAAVALTLAKLSTIVGKMTPAFAGALKGSSPAVFALLASPQFLIATGVAVGVTIVMFGGWKIVKRVREQKAKEEALAYEMAQMNINAAAAAAQPQQEFYGYDNQFHPEDAHQYYQQQRPPTVHPRAHSETGHSQRSMDEALVLDEVEELSTIESWRRGIVPFGEDQSADMELISPKANRAIKERWRQESEFDIRDDVTVTASDSVSQAGGRRRRKPHHGGSTGGSGRSEVSKARSHRSYRSHRDSEVPDRKSSRGLRREDAIPEEDEDAKSSHSSRSHKSSSRSQASHASHKSSKSKHTSRAGVKAIEDGSRDKSDTLSSILSGSKSDVGREKEKKAANMLISMFRKKKERERKAASVLA